MLQAFDDLLLMKVGGQVTYHGHLGKRSRTLIRYFEAIPGVPRCREGLNPATWMLQISTPAMEQRIGVNFADHYAASSAHRYTLAYLQPECLAAGGHWQGAAMLLLGIIAVASLLLWVKHVYSRVLSSSQAYDGWQLRNSLVPSMPMLSTI